MNKKSILIVHNYYQIPGGEDTVVANEMEMLKKHGHKVILYSRNNSELKRMRICQKIMFPINTVFSIQTYKDIKRIIKEENIDIVHVHNTLSLISPSVYYAAEKCGIPVVQSIHNFRMLCPGATFYRNGHICEQCVNEGIFSAVKHSCYRGSRLQTLACVISTLIHRRTGIYKKINYICLTEFNKKKILELKQISENKVYVKPNFVQDNATFLPEYERLDQFVFAGRLDKLKGIDILLDAWDKMGRNAPNLIICGTGPLEDWCKKYISQNQIKAELKGFVPNPEVRKILAKSKALILPTQWYEGFPMSIVESFSVGTPVICSDLGNAGSIVDEGVSGYKFSKNSSEEIARIVLNYNGPYNSTRIVYLNKYTEDVNYTILEKIYNKISEK